MKKASHLKVTSFGKKVRIVMLLTYTASLSENIYFPKLTFLLKLLFKTVVHRISSRNVIFTIFDSVQTRKKRRKKHIDK